MTDADRVRATPPRVTSARLAPSNPARPVPAGPARPTSAGPPRPAASGAVRLGGGHPHIVCRRCGAVADTAAAGHVHPPQAPSLAGFAVDEARVTFWGLCPRCRPAAPPPG